MGSRYSFERKYQLKIIGPGTSKQTLGDNLLLAKNTFDTKIICDGKTFECHKSVLQCQSDVFEKMFQNDKTIESGVVKIEDFKASTIETFLGFCYQQKVEDEEMINIELLYAAEKYNITQLLEDCSEYLKRNLTDKNALDVVVAAYHTKQKSLLERAASYACSMRNRLVKTSTWKEFKKDHPEIVTEIQSLALDW